VNVLVDTSVWSLALRRAKRLDDATPLRSFPDLELESADYEDAALAFNRCREKGIQGSNTDFLLCAVAQRRGLAIFTTDGDFRHYAKVLKVKLHEPRG
jgi:predicted nucleic acid-binding protein